MLLSTLLVVLSLFAVGQAEKVRSGALVTNTKGENEHSSCVEV
jgi:hypothetical protein